MSSQLIIPGFYRPNHHPEKFAPDPCARKHGGNPHSLAAHERVKKYKGGIAERLRVYIHGCDFHGATLAELCKTFHKEKNAISGRLSELKREKRIFDSRRERDHCAVYVTDPRHVALWARPEVKL